ncbi:carboxypeptidase-like regulatory domain-containing protein [Roseateles oligotrophus]|uniref:Carboxypeptidase-like regulatory domain-containing protein n=1 Tax=Roseateles oligotrophus TaxID=1769250 RepID=A0ABT2YGU3_9BURK|nr:carboxypeptidase-like regulatory domain-containing protein [Roseateles oligotrophus]MCV2369274.1 carboxypeptidase-like regulatory domain-containing protein [Roseateles oligotrophus]
MLARNAAWLCLALLLGPLHAPFCHAQTADSTKPDPIASLSPLDIEANALVLEVLLDGHQLSDSLSAYQDGKQLLLPLGELARLLTLAVTVNTEQGSASGFIVREQRQFALSQASGRVYFEGQEQRFPAHSVRLIDGDLYVAQQLLAQWLPIDLSLDLASLQLRIQPRERLPLQERLAREHLGGSIHTQAAAGAAERNFTRTHAPIKAFALPFIEQTLGSQAHADAQGRQLQAVYTAYLTGDLLGLEAAAFVSQARRSNSPALRLTLGRHDPEAGLAGPMQARTAEFGNVAVPGVSNVVAGNASGNGVLLSNRSLELPSNFDRHSLRGDLPPGWDVTLYYNDALAGYQQSRSDGRYAFEDLPLSFGANEFRLVFNGPLGQLRVERKSFLLDQSNVKPGELFYSLAQQRTDAGELRSVAQLDLGLSRAFAANAALVRSSGLPEQGTLGYAQLGLRYYADAYVLSSQLTQAQAGGALAELGLKTRLGKHSIDLQHQQRFGDFSSEILPRGSDPLSHRDKLRLYSTFQPAAAAGMPALPALSIVIEAVHDSLASGASNQALSGRASTMLAGTSVSSSLHWQRLGAKQTNLRSGSFSSDGTLQLSRRIAGIGLSASMAFSIQPAAKLQSLAMTADRDLGAGYRVNAGLQHSIQSNVSQLTAGLSKFLGSFGMALSGSCSSQREFAVGLQLFMAMGHNPRSKTWFFEAQPLAGTGSVSALAFVDRNLNGRRDADEPVVPNAGFILNGGGRHPLLTDEQGSALITRLPAGQYTDIAIDANTLEDPQWRPALPGLRVLPRPGSVEMIEFPIVATSEIDGTVYLLSHDKKGQRRGIGDARIELVNEQGQVIASTISSSDGYYLLHQVMPGRHSLRIAPEQAAKLKLYGQLSRRIDVPADGDFIAAPDFELRTLPR